MTPVWGSLQIPKKFAVFPFEEQRILPISCQANSDKNDFAKALTHPLPTRQTLVQIQITELNKIIRL